MISGNNARTRVTPTAENSTTAATNSTASSSAVNRSAADAADSTAYRSAGPIRTRDANAYSNFPHPVLDRTESISPPERAGNYRNEETRNNQTRQRKPLYRRPKERHAVP